MGSPISANAAARTARCCAKGLDAAERHQNVAGSFRAPRRVPTRVGVVDDVYTTGATVSAAAQALRSRGANRVEVVTFARALRTQRPNSQRGGDADMLR